MNTYEVRIWDIVKETRTKKPTYRVRWKVAKEPTGKSFATKALAVAFRAKLLTAQKEGEPFDTETFLPDSMVIKPKRVVPSWYEFARSYARLRWSESSANERETIAGVLIIVTLALLRDVKGKPPRPVLASALRRWAFRPVTWPVEGVTLPEPPREVASVLDWIARASLPTSALNEAETVRLVLDALRRKVAGGKAAPGTVARRLTTVKTAFKYGVEVKAFDQDPMTLVMTWRRPKVSLVVDDAVVCSPQQARELLTAVSYVGRYKGARGRRLVAFFAVLYYAGLRPEEALALRRSDCDLPVTGWGTLTLSGALPTVGKLWTDSGEVHDERGLKAREDDAKRPVPIPPVLVAILRAHLNNFGTGLDGRLFCTAKGTTPAASTYAAVWRMARPFALTPDQVASSLALVPYDLRHACLSTQLDAGVDAVTVAQRAGNSPAVLLATYAKRVNEREQRVNRLIEQRFEDEGEGDAVSN